MNFKLVCALLIGSSICLSTVYAADTQPNQDEATVVGACMVQKFTKHKPPIAQSKIEKCADVAADAVAKCLGIAEDEYNGIIKTCIARLASSKCMAKKMNVTLMQYANCDYEQDPVACYKALGFTTKQVEEFNTACEIKG